MTTDNSQCINFLDKKKPKFKKLWTHTFTSCTNQEWEPRWNMLKSSAKKKKAGYGTREWWVQTFPVHSLMQCSLVVVERSIGTWSFHNLSDATIQTTTYIATENSSKILPCGHFWPAPCSERGCTVIEILVWRKKWFGRPKFQEK